MKKILIISCMSLSLLGNLWAGYFFWNDYRKSFTLEEESEKIFFREKLFSENYKLKDYSATKFTLEQEGKDIVKNAREFHSSPALLKGEAYNEELCAGYIFELTRKLWDASAPYIIGMMEQNTKKPADAWQLPYSYEYVGGKILSDFTGKFSLQEKDYWEKVDILELAKFFTHAFSERALLGDIGFFYKNTNYIHDLQAYQNANSHITKNIGLSHFERLIENTSEKSVHEVMSSALSCQADIYEQILPLLSHYEFFLDGKRIVLSGTDWYYLEQDSSLGDAVSFQDFQLLSYQDITLMHFFKGARVEPLLEMSCGWDFFPINIMQINPRFIEKM